MTELFKIHQTMIAESTQCDGRKSVAMRPARLLCSVAQIASYLELRFVEHWQSDLVYES